MISKSTNIGTPMFWKLLFLFLYYASFNLLAQDIVNDPVEDFLNLPMDGRYTDVSSITEVSVVSVDIDGDGKQEVLVGHPQPWNGDKFGIYYAAYSELGQGYKRLTADRAAVRIDPRFFGDRASTFVGHITETSSEGVLILTNDYYQEDLKKFDSATVYSIVGGQLVITELGSIDLTTKEGQEFYNRYFGEDIESRSIETEDLTAVQLQELGYELPSWKQLPGKPDGTPEAASPKTAVVSEAASHVTDMPAATALPEDQSVDTESPSTLFWLIGISIIAAIIIGAVVIRRKV